MRSDILPGSIFPDYQLIFPIMHTLVVERVDLRTARAGPRNLHRLLPGEEPRNATIQIRHG